MISIASIKLLDPKLMGDFYFTTDKVEMAKRLLKIGCYKEVHHFAFDGDAREAAEEAFDLTNNPSRQYERNKYYGKHRSVSVGDLVEVDGVHYLCDNFGWVVV